MAVPIKMKPAGIRYVLTHPLVADEVDVRGAKIARAAGPGFIQVRRTKRVRRYGNTIRTHTDEARIAQAESNVLMRSIDAGR